MSDAPGIDDPDEPSCPQCAAANARADYASAEQQATLDRLYHLEAAQNPVRDMANAYRAKAAAFDELLAHVKRVGCVELRIADDGTLILRAPH